MELVGNSTEHSLKRLPYREKIVVSAVRDQGDTDTCFINSSCTCVESLNKRKGALAKPQEDFEVILSASDLTQEYVKLYGLIGQEPKGETGFIRLLRVLQILKDPGIVGVQDEVVCGPFKIQSFQEIEPVFRHRATKRSPNVTTSHPQDVKNLFSRGNVLIGTFRISTNYKKLEPGDIYTYDKRNPETVDGQRCSHAVAIIGYGVKDGCFILRLPK